MATNPAENKLYYGDNLTLMQDKIADESIDLIYLDPPFNSNKSYNKIYKTATGLPVPEQSEAFCDTWEMDQEKEALIEDMPEKMRQYKVGNEFIDFWFPWTQALRKISQKLLAYVVYMTVRLLEMKRILKPTGSLYLHCDPTASHYIKITLDSIFGQKNFRNEIVWHYYNKYSAGKRVFGRNYDQIFFYSKLANYHFNPLREKRKKPVKQLVRENVDGVLKNKKGDDGKIMYRIVKDKKIDAVWSIPCLQPASKENLGYPTQKPILLLNRIIKASCPPGGVVLDPFCGCGTTLHAAQEINNAKQNDPAWKNITWMGIDIAIFATNLVQKTLAKRYGLLDPSDYQTEGIPVSVEGARKLWEQDKHQFQNWAVEYVLGFCNLKKSHDRGIDGKIYFYEITREKVSRELKHMVISVKGGKLKAQDVRDLMGVMEREEKNGAVFGGLIAFDEPSRGMRQDAATVGSYYDNSKNRYPKLQFLTVKEMIEEQKLFRLPNTPRHKEGLAEGEGGTFFEAAPPN